jgi:hypothetical protein
MAVKWNITQSIEKLTVRMSRASSGMDECMDEWDLPQVRSAAPLHWCSKKCDMSLMSAAEARLVIWIETGESVYRRCTEMMAEKTPVLHVKRIQCMRKGERKRCSTYDYAHPDPELFFSLWSCCTVLCFPESVSHILSRYVYLFRYS